MADGVPPGREFVLETPRLLLRPSRVAEAAVHHELWVERDSRVPPHRRIDAEGHPTVADLEDWIRANPPSYELLRRVWGQGYATEASLAVLDWARSPGYRRLWASVWEWNTASQRVLAKLGFTETAQRIPASVRGGNLLTARQL